ncbi:sensor histidine kinase [Nesterenkonia sp. CF4.4]|uniref:sensor histidine kinase n=1 Tax=Nesterenkonia sp. CF4.4 TaxID=3373079 RepID=UPI003EE806F5
MIDRPDVPLDGRRFATIPPLIVLALIPLLFAVPEFVDSGTVVYLTTGVLLVQALLLIICARFPGLVLAGITAADSALFILDPGNTSAGLAVPLAVYVLRRALPRRAAAQRIIPLGLVSMTIAAAIGSGGELVAAGEIPLGIARGLLLYLLPWVIAEVIIGRTQLVQALTERAEMAEREQELAARHAVQEQRTMIARELHDIAAHHLTGIIVSAQAASALTQTDPPGQRRYLQAVQSDARSALENLRRTVGLLRADEESTASRAASLNDLPQVIEAALARGTRVQLHESGEAWSLGPVAGVVVIRGIEEALANIAKHASGAEARLTVRWEPHRLSLEITDDGAAGTAPTLPASGYGLTGLRERLALVHGTLEAGASGTGWRTAFSVPREHAAREGESA